MSGRLEIPYYDYFLHDDLPDRKLGPAAWYEYSHGTIEFSLLRYSDCGCYSEEDNQVTVEVEWDQRGKFRSSITVTHECISIWQDTDRYDFIPTFMLKNMDDLRTMVADIIALIREAIEREHQENKKLT